MGRGVLLLAALLACDGGTTTRAADMGTDGDGDGWSLEEGDCDDGAPGVFPGATEVWYDGVDQDCAADNDADRDGDGVVGGPAGTDCLDADPLAFPGAAERCNGQDDDCDGEVDEEAVDPAPLYTDNDGDGYGAGNEVGSACTAVSGTTFTEGDCDDGDASVLPGAVERCDGADNDCDGSVDKAPVDGFPVFADTDGDGYGDATSAGVACTLEADWSGTGSDCDDTDALTHPTAAELCDRRDNDCNGTVDDGATADRTWYPDGDSDGDGVLSGAQTACDEPAGFADNNRDCDDADSARHHGAVETCNNLDDDCDGVGDDEAADATWFYPDDDADGYGDEAAGLLRCTAPAGFLPDGTDCDDADPLTRPGGTESCNGVDDDCDGATDERTATGTRSFFLDGDGDGYGAGTLTTAACSTPHGWALLASDCDDGDARVNPGARERCDTLDNDCDGVVDELVPDAPTWYADSDGDGYGAGSATTSCEAPSSSVNNALDCDDSDPTIRPGVAETENTLDDDCDVLVDEDWLTPGAVVVTEIDRQPYAGGSGTSTNVNVQWFEVFNPGTRAVDLSGWNVAEQDGDGFYVPPDEGLIVEPSAYLVFCYGTVGFANAADCAYTWGDRNHGAPWFDDTFYFDRDEDLVALRAGPLLIDEVHWTYDETLGYWPRTATYSMRLDDDALSANANDDYAAWCNASTSVVWSGSSYPLKDYGSPGAANGSCD